MTLHICDPPKTWIRRIAVCPVCHERHRIIGMSQEWYDTVWTCCRCGDRWEGGELLERPFRHGWRTESIKRARFNWINAHDLNQ